MLMLRIVEGLVNATATVDRAYANEIIKRVDSLIVCCLPSMKEPPSIWVNGSHIVIHYLISSSFKTKIIVSTIPFFTI